MPTISQFQVSKKLQLPAFYFISLKLNDFDLLDKKKIAMCNLHTSTVMVFFNT